MSKDAYIEPFLRMPNWKLMALVISLSEFFTVIMNSINSYLWWGRLDTDLLLIGSVDAFVVSLLVGGMLVFLFSIVRSKEKALSTSEDKYKTVVDSSPIGITVCDSTGQCIAVNQAMADIVGATTEQILKQNYHNIESWKVSGLYDKAISAVKNQRVEQHDTRLTSSFGKEIYFSTYIIPFISGGLFFMALDITAQKKVEEELKEHRDNLDALVAERTRDLNESELRFKLFFENAAVGMALVTLDRRLV
ncbi:PAS domain-containing protein [Nitrospirota bacterium]